MSNLPAKRVAENAAHGVHVSNDALRSFNSRTAALDFAASKVYLDPLRRRHMEQLLTSGQEATWVYGATSVTVYPGIP